MYVLPLSLLCCMQKYHVILNHSIMRVACQKIAYHQTSNISHTKSKQLNFLVLSCSCLCPIHWSQMLSWEWRCSWSSVDRRCSNFIWAINKFMTSKGSSYIKGLTVTEIQSRDIYYQPIITDGWVNNSERTSRASGLGFTAINAITI